MNPTDLEAEFSHIVHPGFFQMPESFVDQVAAMLRDLEKFNLRVERVQPGELGPEVFFRGWFAGQAEADAAYRTTQEHGFNGGLREE